MYIYWIHFFQQMKHLTIRTLQASPTPSGHPNRLRSGFLCLRSFDDSLRSRSKPCNLHKFADHPGKACEEGTKRHWGTCDHDDDDHHQHHQSSVISHHHHHHQQTSSNIIISHQSSVISHQPHILYLSDLSVLALSRNVLTNTCPTGS